MGRWWGEGERGRGGGEVGERGREGGREGERRWGRGGEGKRWWGGGRFSCNAIIVAVEGSMTS